MMPNEDQIIEMIVHGFYDDYIEALIEEGQYDDCVIRRAKTAASIYLEMAEKMFPV